MLAEKATRPPRLSRLGDSCVRRHHCVMSDLSQRASSKKPGLRPPKVAQLKHCEPPAGPAFVAVLQLQETCVPMSWSCPSFRFERARTPCVDVGFIVWVPFAKNLVTASSNSQLRDTREPSLLKYSDCVTQLGASPCTGSRPISH
jgi:hypothetical protein